MNKVANRVVGLAALVSLAGVLPIFVAIAVDVLTNLEFINQDDSNISAFSILGQWLGELELLIFRELDLLILTCILLGLIVFTNNIKKKTRWFALVLGVHSLIGWLLIVGRGYSGFSWI